MLDSTSFITYLVRSPGSWNMLRLCNNILAIRLSVNTEQTEKGKHWNGAHRTPSHGGVNAKEKLQEKERHLIQSRKVFPTLYALTIFWIIFVWSLRVRIRNVEPSSLAVSANTFVTVATLKTLLKI